MADAADCIRRFKNAEAAFGAPDGAFTGALDGISAALASDIELRLGIGADPAVWPVLRTLWRRLSDAQTALLEARDEDEDGDGDDDEARHLRRATLSLARFTRNLVAAVPQNQDRAFENEREVRRLLHFYTSWSVAGDAEAVAAARMLTQTLSNMVTGNERLMSALWQAYLALPEDQVVLLRLLAHPDSRTVLSTLIFMLNILRDSEPRITALCSTPVGLRLCVLLLDTMARAHDADEASAAGRAFEHGYLIFAQLMAHARVPALYARLAVPGEPVAPHQTTLLKLTDAYLQARARDAGAGDAHEGLLPLLAGAFLALAASARGSLARAAARGGPAGAPPAELDVRLPKVCEALVLVAQCAAAAALAGEARGRGGWRARFADARADGVGLVESLVDVLRLLDVFLPRINFGKPVGRGGAGGAPAAADSPGFFYLKRDLVRLLGVLAHRERAVQDRVRACGGIQVVMNLCVVDERNPYLREHAIFTLHNLLEGNAENQALVDEIQPVREADENGVLKPVSVPLP
ncbi:spinocerebellar ataxia type 10 protein domain-containing protein [Schizophyllum fasciatum]